MTFRLPLFATLLALESIHASAAEPKTDPVYIRLLGAGNCQVLEKPLPCSDVVTALKAAGIAKSTPLQLQIVPGITLGEVVPLISGLKSAGFTGLSETIGAVPEKG